MGRMQFHCRGVCDTPLRRRRHKPQACGNHNQAGNAVEAFAGGLADGVDHLSDQNQGRGGADAEEEHHEGSLEHAGKGVLRIHGGSCGGEQGGVGEAAGEKAEDDAHRVVAAD